MKIVTLALLLAVTACGQAPQKRAGADPGLAQAEKLWAAHDYKSANNAFRDLVKLDPKNPEYRVRWGRLLMERFNKAEAAGLFSEALEIQPNYAPALLGQALLADQGFEGKAIDLTRKAIEADPKSVEARELLARVRFEDNDNKGAAEEADAALALDPDALDAMAIRASLDLIADKPADKWFTRIFAKDSHYGKAYEIAGYFFFLNRRYEEAIVYYGKATALTPDLYSAHSQLGVNLMRLGREEAARTELEIAYNNGYKDEVTVNSLRLIDSYKRFTTYTTDNTILRLRNDEAEVLRPYFEAEMKKCIEVYQKKYQFQLAKPVQVEVYPDHEDFAVRTMGMPGMGALGVTFNYVIAMDSPSGRKPGEFHWASTLWHEMSHVFTLAETNYRIPRWFTEGIAVHEETAAAPDWGDRLSPPVIKAIQQKKLLPIAEIDRGFMHPTYPDQVIVSYFQGGKICDYIAQKYGEGKILEMIRAFSSVTTTEAVVREHLHMEPAEFDKQFLAWVENDTKTTVAGYTEWRAKATTLNDLYKAAKYDEVIKTGLAIRDMYPDYVEHGSVYVALADAYIMKGEKDEALKQLSLYSKVGGREPEQIKKLATMLEAANRPKDAAAALERLNYIAPNDPVLHQRLGGLLLAQGNASGAIREFYAVVASKPLDQATAHYDLARAYHAAKQDDKAREQVEQSLEAAPSFKPAQKLLLELHPAS